MGNHRLLVTEVEKKNEYREQSKNRSSWKQEIQGRMERLWLQDPEQFNPERDCIQRERITKTLEVLTSTVDLKGKSVADLGCGAGVLSRLIRDKGATVDAVDIAGNALACLKMGEMERIRPIQDALPSTSLADEFYDVVVCTEVIGFLPQKTHRLFFSELSRVVKLDGHVVCSTEFDLSTESPLERFNAIAETEFTIDTWVLSYHRLFIRLCQFFEKPAYLADLNKRPEVRNTEMEKRRTLVGKWLLKLNVTTVGSFFWSGVALVSVPIARWLRQSPKIMNQLEKVSYFIWSEEGISHALFVGRKRPLEFPLPQNEIPREMRHKKEVWE